MRKTELVLEILSYWSSNTATRIDFVVINNMKRIYYLVDNAIPTEYGMIIKTKER